MKLYLSSYGLGNEPQRLVDLVGDNKRAAVILDAMDWADADKRQDRLDRELVALAGIGLQPEEVDLREYFGKPEALETTLSEFGLLWIRGGNCFLLRKAMALSGFDTMIRRLLDKDIVYGGYSAACCLAGPTLRGIELCDDVNLTADGYPAETMWDGLGLIDYTIAPHYRSDHPESAMIEDVVQYFEEHGMPYKPLRDGEVIIVNE